MLLILPWLLFQQLLARTLVSLLGAFCALQRRTPRIPRYISERLHLRLPSFVDPLPRGVSEVSGRYRYPPPSHIIGVLWRHIYIYDLLTISLSNVKSFGLLCHQVFRVVVHWQAQPAYRRSGETIIVSIPLLLVPLFIRVSLFIVHDFVRGPVCE